MKVNLPPAQVFMMGDVLPNGNGGYTVTPKKPTEELSPKNAAKFLGISRSGIYRLLDLGVIACSRPSPRKILIPAESLRSHQTAVRDPEYWSGQVKK